jgi:hypothetical protein
MRRRGWSRSCLVFLGLEGIELHGADLNYRVPFGGILVGEPVLEHAASTILKDRSETS